MIGVSSVRIMTMQQNIYEFGDGDDCGWQLKLERSNDFSKLRESYAGWDHYPR